MGTVGSVVYLDEARVVEHVFSSALNDWGITWDKAVGRQYLQSVAPQRNIAPEQKREIKGKLILNIK